MSRPDNISQHFITFGKNMNLFFTKDLPSTNSIIKMITRSKRFKEQTRSSYSRNINASTTNLPPRIQLFVYYSALSRRFSVFFCVFFHYPSICVFALNLANVTIRWLVRCFDRVCLGFKFKLSRETWMPCATGFVGRKYWGSCEATK